MLLAWNHMYVCVTRLVVIYTHMAWLNNTAAWDPKYIVQYTVANQSCAVLLGFFII